jgi:MFS family permease
VRGIAMLGLTGAAWAHLLNLPMLYGAAFLIGVAETITNTSAQALVPMVVERGRLRRANGLIYGVQTVMNDFVGAPLGAALLTVGTLLALAVPAGLYLGGSLALLALAGAFGARRELPAAKGPASVLHEAKEGLVTLWRDTALRRLALYGAVSAFTNMAFFAVFVVFAVGKASSLHLSSFEYSLLLTAAATGAVTGSALADRLGRLLPPKVVLTAVLVALAVCFGTPALIANPFAVAGALMFSGFITAVGGVVSVSLRQALAPEHLIGRVSAGSRVLSLGAQPLGALAGGAVAEWLSPRGLFAILAVVVLFAVPLTLRVPDDPDTSA